MPSRPPLHAPRVAAAERFVWSLLLSSSIVYFFWTNEADNDLWGHVLFGRTILATGLIPRIDTYAYTTAGQPWIDHEWLSQALMGALYGTLGSAGLVVAKFAVAVGVFALVLARLRRRSTAPTIQGVIGLLAIAGMARGFGIRPQILTYLGIAVLLLLLDDYQRGRRAGLWALPAMFVLWANLHGGFVLGLGILGLFAGADLLNPDRSVRPWAVLIASTAATALNPYGPRLLLYIWNELSRAHPISEWQPATFGPEHLAFFCMLALFVVTLPFSQHWRRHGWEALLALAIGLIALRHQRHTPVFAICAAAPLASQLEHGLDWIAKRAAFTLSPASRRVIGAAIVALALLQVGLTGLRYRYFGAQIAFNSLDYPVAAVKALQRAGARGNLAVPLDWGEYVLWFLAPQIKVSLDGRFATVFSEQVVEDNFNFFMGAPGWEQLLERYPTEAALVPAGWPCPVRSLPDWRLAYRDRSAEIYVKGDRAERLRMDSPPLDHPATQVPVGIFP